MSTRGIYHFFWDLGRMGELAGIFVATDEQVKFLVGKTVDFGEALGKHSQVDGGIEEGDIRLLTEDQEFIDRAVVYGLVPTGYNPVEQYKDNHMDDDPEDDGGWPFDD